MTKTIKKKEENNIQQWTDEQLSLIKSQIAQGATNDELQLFLYYAQKSQLDPLAKQIYLVKRQGKMAIQTSIDGFRLIAERSGDYSGQDVPEFEEKQGLNHPNKCTVTVYKLDRLGNRVPYSGVAYWDEYKPAQGQDFMWNKMPHTMLAKVAESLALRKAFPQDLSGLYTDDEMSQADSSPSDNNTIRQETIQNKPVQNVTGHSKPKIVSKVQSQTMTLRERAEKWLDTLPEKVQSVLSAEGEQYIKERDELLTQLYSGKALVDNNVDNLDLKKKVEEYIDMLQPKKGADLTDQFGEAMTILDGKEIV